MYNKAKTIKPLIVDALRSWLPALVFLIASRYVPGVLGATLSIILISCSFAFGAFYTYIHLTEAVRVWKKV